MALLMVLLFAKLMIKLFLTELSHQEVEVRRRCAVVPGGGGMSRSRTCGTE